MSNYAREFIDTQYTPVTLLSDSPRTRVEIVKSPEGPLAVKKTIHTPLPIYHSLKDADHFGLPRILDVVITDGETIVVEEYISGETLQQYLQRQEVLPVWQIIDFMEQLAGTLCFVHDLGIVHRDIKPSNILISTDSVIKLIDFDSARNYDADKQYDTVYLGTKGYAAPEQYGYAQSDFRSDIYSFGVVLNELITPHPYDQLTASIQTVISLCTQIDPEQRYQDTVLLLQDLQILAADCGRYTFDSYSDGFTETVPARLRSNFSAHKIWRVILVILFTILVCSAAVGDNTFSLSSIGTIIEYLLLYLPPVLFWADLFQIRSIPIVPLFRERPARRFYGPTYFVVWIVLFFLFARIHHLFL